MLHNKSLVNVAPTGFLQNGKAGVVLNGPFLFKILITTTHLKNWFAFFTNEYGVTKIFVLYFVLNDCFRSAVSTCADDDNVSEQASHTAMINLLYPFFFLTVSSL